MPRPPTPEELRLVAEDEQIAAALATTQPGVDTPYFARLQLLTAAGRRDVLLAARTLAVDVATLVDWSSAPLTAVFLEHRPGDDYEVEHAGRTLTGTVLRRHLVEFQRGTLTAVVTDDVTLRRDAHGWRADDEPGPRLRPRPPSARTRPLSPAHVQLDPVQRAAVDLPSARSLLVLGEAGFGKTTVALHRLARLAHAAQDARRTFRALVLVPTTGLRRLLTHTLEQLAVPHTRVDTFSNWSAREAARVFPDLPRRTSADVDPAVARLKRHPALRSVFARISAGTPAMHALRRGYRDAPETTRELLLHLFGDRELLDEVVASADLPRTTVPAVLAHTRTQFTPTSERALRHVDSDRLKTLDGRPLDADTPFKNCETIDPEDIAVVFALHRKISGTDKTRHGALSNYEHILVDEAQELAPIELELVGRALAPGGTMTIAGDERQQVDATNHFAGWPGVLHELALHDPAVVSLAVSYRCPPAIEAAARRALDPTLPAPTADPALLRTAHASPCHLVTALADALLPLLADDPQISVAIVCRHIELAERLHDRLCPVARARLVLDGAFSFRPGVDITTVQTIKGLEFAVVIVPDADARTYPDDPAARRALYVAMTRATHQLWLMTAGAWAPALA